MIYMGPTNDYRLRYHLKTNVPQGSDSPNAGRFSRFRANPIDNRANPIDNRSITSDVANSLVYTKPGQLKRNAAGWDGVKLSEYVI